MENIDSILETIGMTSTEYNVYRILLQNSKSTAGVIIKKSSLHRATVYDVLNRLMEKGLAGYVIINKKKHYSASEPSKILDILSEKRKKMETEESQIADIVKHLASLRQQSKIQGHIATIYEGKEGLKTIMQDILETGKDFCTIGGKGLRFQEHLPIYTKLWAKERERLKVYARKIITQPVDSSWKYNIDKRIPKEYSMPSAVLIYGNKVAIVVNSSPLTIILIDNKSVAQSYLSYFNMLWDRF